jgi:hypothetical protein
MDGMDHVKSGGSILHSIYGGVAGLTHPYIDGSDGWERNMNQMEGGGFSGRPRVAWR